MIWITPPLSLVAAEPLLLTDDVGDVIAEALAQLGAMVGVPQRPVLPILVADMEDLPAELVPRGVWGLYGNQPHPFILVQRGLPAFMLRSLLRHELAHAWQDRAGLPPDEAFPARFGRDRRFRADVLDHLRGLGLPPAPAGWTYRPERDGRGGLAWRLRSAVRIVRVPVPESRLATGGSGVFDSDTPYEHFILVPDRLYVIVEAEVWLHFKQFTASAKSAVASGTLTSDSGGGSTSGSSSASTSGSGGPHTHVWGTGGAGTGFAVRVYTDGGGTDFELSTNTTSQLMTDESVGHDHGIAHSHTTPAHQHTVPTHTHGLVYGIFAEAMPASIDVVMGVYHKEGPGEPWSLMGSVSGIDEEEMSVDLLTTFQMSPGIWKVTLQSAPGQPNGGRLGVDIAGAIIGAIQSV